CGEAGWAAATGWLTERPAPPPAWSGWQAASAKAASETIPKCRTRSDHDIDDPLRDDDHFLQRPSVACAYYRFEFAHSLFHLGGGGGGRNRDFVAPLPVDLHRQRNRIGDKKRGLRLRPAGLGDKARSAQRRPAFLGQMRHHRRDEMDQNLARFVQRETAGL